MATNALGKSVHRILFSLGALFCSAIAFGQSLGKPQLTELLAHQGKPDGFGPGGFLAQTGKSSSNFDYKIDVIWVRDGQRERIEPEVLTLGDTFRLNGDGPQPGVYATENERHLVWGPKGWAWVPIQAPWEFIPFNKEIDKAVSSASIESAKQTNGEGWTLHRGWLLEVNPTVIRTEPNPTSHLITLPYSSMKEGEAHFESHGKYLPEGAPPPSEKELKWEKQPVARTSLLAFPIERKGDWIKIMLPAPGSSAVKILFWGVPGDDDPGVLVRWNSKTTGWVQWRSSGTQPGTHQFFEGLGFSFWGFQ